ncbi:hypothetical protein [Agromyces humi]|uniref:hypothetical protein n=1 Tax=Agromyces humi TaxID=1766800 RepID=UPI00135A8E8B|nr:hypothetical protein [Agromyces humi]
MQNQPSSTSEHSSTAPEPQSANRRDRRQRTGWRRGPLIAAGVLTTEQVTRIVQRFGKGI